MKLLIKENSIILNVANCKVENAFSFYECLYKFEKNQNLGYCMDVKEILRLASTLSNIYKIALKNFFLNHWYLFLNLEQDDNELNECCSMNVSATNYCFKWNSKQYYKQVNIENI